jgi:hypothetical protein
MRSYPWLGCRYSGGDSIAFNVCGILDDGYTEVVFR